MAMAPAISLLVKACVVAAVLGASDATGATSTRAQPTAPTASNRCDIIVTLRDRNTAPIDQHRKSYGQSALSRSDKVTKLKEGLEAHAKSSQVRVQDVIKSMGGHFNSSESFWVTNQVFVQRASPQLINKLRQLPQVESVTLDQVHPVVTPVMESNSTPYHAEAITATYTANAKAWGVSKISAPSVWNTGNNGAGIVIGALDTGVRATHQALAASFRSSYGWYDPETKSSKPYDATGHGTHVVGIMVGAKGLGVAPGAKWIACKACRTAGCYTSDIVTCLQFMLCPTTTDGKNKDCSKAPHIVNNSWGGSTSATSVVTAYDALIAAGIMPVVAAGNMGPACGTLESPGDLNNVLTVGATDSADNVASYSSKGPNAAGVVKPDIVAPGSLIYSTCYTGDTDYCTKSGTSMATPHVSGAVALMLSAKPTLTFDEVKKMLKTKAVSSIAASGYACGSPKTADSVRPNNQFGYGRIDVAKALA